jgi:2-amino-4-hydroxy-6-hydroxymethyldihydropteridine diphosphokinase
MPGVTLLAVSRPRKTRPIGGPPGQGPFLNSACLIETDLGPHDVLGMLAAIENTLHRERGERWAARTIDLDVLLYDDLVLDSEKLTLPHPRMTTRRFVLEPCAEIAPAAVHPLSGCTVKDLLDNISRPHPHIAVVGVPGAGAPEVAAALADATLARLVHAPVPLPTEVFQRSAGGEDQGSIAASSEDVWHRSLDACARPLEAACWPRDPHGTVTDYWLETLRLAAEDVLPAAARDRFYDAFARTAPATVAPHVVILLSARPEDLEERIAFRSRQPPPQSDIFADVSPSPTTASAAAVCNAPQESVRLLMQLQKRLACRLRTPAGGHGIQPRAVVEIDAGDLGRAALDAVSAVEAMA